jgi:hypothetical protein
LDDREWNLGYLHPRFHLGFEERCSHPVKEGNKVSPESERKEVTHMLWNREDCMISLEERKFERGYVQTIEQRVSDNQS